MIFNEPESVFSIISDLGHEHFQAETAQDRTEQKDDSLKTTSVRMHEKQLAALDAVCRGISMTRQDAIQLAVRQFIGDAVAGYAIGRASAYARGDEKAASKEMTAFLDGLNLDADTRKYISDLATDVFVVEMGII